MPDYVDPRQRGIVATGMLALYIIAQLIAMMTTAFAEADSRVDGIAAVMTLAAMIAAVVTTSFWIYRINANAHTLADGLAITPGWNVGWFFVPIANLWKPFEGIKETWQASENPADWPAVAVPALLRAWWGCWLVGNMLSNVSARLSKSPGDPTSIWIDLAASALLIAAAALLIRIIKLLSLMQRQARAAQAFV